MNKPNKKILSYFIKKFWFIPPDVLQRSLEANVWNEVKFIKPILSVGIGNGEVDSLLFRKHRVMDIGIDIDDSQFEFARSLGIYKQIIKADVEKMPFRNSMFSSVISNSTLEHVANLDQAISEVSRVLKKNGLMIFTTPSDFLQKWILEYELKTGEIQAKKNLSKFNKRASHLNYLSFKKWGDLLSKYNLEIIEHRYYFPKEVAIVWYKLFKLFTTKIHNREVWSYLGHSWLNKLLPKNIFFILEFMYLEKYFNKGVFVKRGIGAQHFLIARKR